MAWPSTRIWVQEKDGDKLRLREISVDNLFEDLDDGERSPIEVYRFHTTGWLASWDWRQAYTEHQQDRADQIRHDAGTRRMQRP